MRSQVPEPLRGTVAHRRDLRAQGVSDGRLRSKSVRRPFRGVHADAGVAASVERRIRDVVPLLPGDGVIGGWAAAWLHGARDLDGVVGGRELPVTVCVPRTRRMRERPGVRPLRSDLHGEVEVVRGVPVTSAARTAVDLARLCREPRDGVVAIDALWAAGATTGPAVLALAEDLPGLQGIPTARAAARLAEHGVRSRPETVLRMIWQLDAGLPRPLVNERLVYLDGNHLGRPDLLDVESGTVGEYDGAGHLALDVTTVDNVRQEGLEGQGLIVVRFTALDARRANRTRTVWRLQQARQRGLVQPGPRTWRVER